MGNKQTRFNETITFRYLNTAEPKIYATSDIILYCEDFFLLTKTAKLIFNLKRSHILIFALAAETVSIYHVAIVKFDRKDTAYSFAV